MSQNSTYRYQLDKSSKKVRCDSCGQKTAVLYVDIETIDYLPDIVQRCDRENKCGHHYTPKQYFIDNPNEKENTHSTYHLTKLNIQVPALQQLPIEYIPIKYVEKSMTGFEQSNFALYLQQLFGENISKKLLLKYFVGRLPER